MCEKRGRQKGLLSRILFTVGGMVLAMSGLMGCGHREEDAVGMEPQKGRYLETEMILPKEWEDCDIRQLLCVEGKLHFLLQGREEGKEGLQEWRLEEDGSFVEVTKEWLSKLSLPYEQYGKVKLMQDAEGTQYVYACYAEAGEDFYKGHLWRGEEMDAVDITPEKWTVMEEQYGIYDYPNGIALTSAGTLASCSYLSMDTIVAEDGTVAASASPSGFYGEWMEALGEHIYQYTLDNAGEVTAVEIRDVNQNIVDTIPFSQQQAGYVYMDVLEDGAIVAADTDGFFKCEAGDSNWKRIINGADTSFGLTSVWCQEIAALPDGSFYALFDSDTGRKLMQYQYDPEAVIEVTETLKLYTVTDSFLLQQAAALYHKEHPEVMIEIESRFSKLEGDTGEADYDKIYQELNTVLMSDEGPDILVLDGLNVETYASKGLLVDIEDIVAPMEAEGTLLANITEGYRRENGKRYAVPLQFGMMLVIGREIAEEEAASMETLARTLSAKGESCMGPQTVPELVDKFYPFFAGEILQNKELNRERLAKKLEQLKQIGDNCGIIEKRGRNEKSYNVWDIAYRCKLAFYETDGFNEAMLPFSAADFVNGSCTCFEQAFYPKLEIAINSKSEYVDTAKDFLKFALSEEIQSNDYYEGFPVNAASLKELAGRDRTNAEACTTIEIDEGMEEEFVIKTFSEERAQQLVEMCKTASVRVAEDAQLREVLIEALPEYLKGAKSLEETLDIIEGGLKMYLAE